jgi:hypothetical protein
MRTSIHRLVLVLVLSLLVVCPTGLLAHPGSAIAVNRDGRVFFVDTGGGLFSIEHDGRLQRHDGPAFHWFALDATGRFRQTPWPSIPGGELRAVGSAPTIVLSSDVPVAVDGRAFYFPEAAGEGRIRIVAVLPSGARSVRAVLPPVHRLGSVVTWLNGLAPGPNGSLYYTEDKAVRKIDRKGTVTTLSNVPSVPNCAAIPGSEEVDRPYLRGLGVARDGTVYVAAAACGALLKITPRGVSTVLLRTSAPWSPTAVSVVNGEVYVLEYLHTASDERREWLPRVRKIQRNGTVVTLANITGR